jgi:uncharacterized protein (TIGR02391 family)
MPNALATFESIARRVPVSAVPPTEPVGGLHDFDLRNIHPRIEKVSKELFDDGHYAQATFEAFKLLDNEVQHVAKSGDSGTKLMMGVFGGVSPTIRLTRMTSASEKDEQEGYKFLFAGSMLAIRNPRGHTVGLADSLGECLDHLTLASLLLRRLEARVP